MSTHGSSSASSSFQNVWESFTRRDHQVQQLLASHNGRDKLIKFSIAFFSLICAIVRSCKNVSPEARDGLEGATEFLKHARTVTGLLNAVGDTPGRIKESIHKIIYLAKDLQDLRKGATRYQTLEVTFNTHQGDDYQTQLAGLNDEEKIAFKEEIYNKVLENLSEADNAKKNEKAHRKLIEVNHGRGYKTETQMAMGIAAEILKIIGFVSFFWAFGVARQISFAGRFTQLSHVAKKMGEQFAIFMFINHISTVAATSLDIVREGLYYSEFMGSEKAKDKGLAKEKFNKLFDAQRRNLLTWIGNGCDMGLDIVGIFRYQAPVGVSIGLGLVIGGVELYNAWLDAGKAASGKAHTAKEKCKDYEKYYATRSQRSLVQNGLETIGGGMGAQNLVVA